MVIKIIDKVKFIIEAYYNAEIMPQIVSENVITKLQNDEYTNEETELLCNVIMEKYDKLYPDISGMANWMIETYYNTDIMPQVISKDIVEKLENAEYADEEIELLYAATTEKYDKLLGC